MYVCLLEPLDTAPTQGFIKIDHRLAIRKLILYHIQAGGQQGLARGKHFQIGGIVCLVKHFRCLHASVQFLTLSAVLVQRDFGRTDSIKCIVHLLTGL